MLDNGKKMRDRREGKKWERDVDKEEGYAYISEQKYCRNNGPVSDYVLSAGMSAAVIPNSAL